MRALSWVVVVALTWVSIGMAACGNSYELTFRCNPGGELCPVGQVCPQLPLGSGGCEDLPSLFGHPAIPVNAGRPIGCVAELPFENPYFPGDQQPCFCQSTLVPGDASVVETAGWECPL